MWNNNVYVEFIRCKTDHRYFKEILFITNITYWKCLEKDIIAECNELIWNAVCDVKC